MIVDASVLVALIFGSEKREELELTLVHAEKRQISVLALLEASVRVQASFGGRGVALLNKVIGSLNIEVVPFDANSISTALAGSMQADEFGDAPLSLGECATYALAKSQRREVLFDDGPLSNTDIAAVVHHQTKTRLEPPYLPNAAQG
ncbi:MAG: type II toxin-antitoxin system VapC family toxin [Neomegalonema sp.]|nr:type II toxin-antitoxin system VapC family toxin [Neomegalonema sp.]